MVELDNTTELQAQNRERASEIFQNIFSEIFLANCGNPVDFETTKNEIEKKMKIQFDENQLEQFEKYLLEADKSNKSSLTKEQMRAFLLRCMEANLFADFFAQKDHELAVTVDSLFEEYFAEVFNQGENPGQITNSQLQGLIDEKFAGDEFFKEVLNSELDKVQSPEAGENQIVADSVVKNSLRVIIQKQRELIINQNDANEVILEEFQQSTGGGYARQMIQRIIQSYKESGVTSGDPFQELKDLLDLFFDDQQVNNYTTMVCGSDLCEMLGLFHDLAEAINNLNIKKISELEKFKIAYNNRVRRDKRKEQEEQEEKKRVVEEDEKFALVRKHNTELSMQNSQFQRSLEDMKESLDLLILENDEKDKYISELELDIKDKSQHTEHLSKGAKLMTFEAAERETKMTQMKHERDIKEKEAAAHLAMVEQKAKRVDELEGQLLLLNMDKDNLKKEINILSEELVQKLDGGAGGTTNKYKGFNRLACSKKSGLTNHVRQQSEQVLKMDDSDSDDLEVAGGAAAMFDRNSQMIGGVNSLARSGTMKKVNRISAPLGGLFGLKNRTPGAKLPQKDNRSKNLLNLLAQSQRTDGPGNNKMDDDNVSDFNPPGNDFFTRAQRLSVWSRSSSGNGETKVQIVDGESSDQSADVSIRRLSDDGSFAGRSQRSHSNSIAGMSRGSFSSQGSKGIRNFLGSKFKKRAEGIKKTETGNALGQSQRSKGNPGLLMPGQPMGSHGLGKNMDGLNEQNTILEDMDSDISGDFSADALNYNYDVINLKEESNPFHNAVKDLLVIYNKRANNVEETKASTRRDSDDDFSPEKALASPRLLAVEVQIWMSFDQPKDAIFVLADDIAIFLFKDKKNIVVTPFKITDVRDFVLAENVPSACTLQVDETVEDKIGRSHLIFESKSMGLIMRYILEREYDIEVDFSDSVPIRERGVQKDFCFTELDILKQEKKDENNNGTVRATINGPIHILEEGGVFSSDMWVPLYGIMTNLGLFRYDRQQTLLILPKIMRLPQLQITAIKGMYQGRANCFRLDYLNDKEKLSQKIFSVDEPEHYQVWLSKIRQTIKEYRELGNRILLAPSQLQTDQIDKVTGSAMLTQEESVQASRRLSKKVTQTPVGRLTTKIGL